MQAFRDWLLIGLHEFWLHLFDLFPLSWFWIWIHTQAFFNLKIHTHSWLLHKTLKLKRKVVLTRALNKIWDTWVLGLVLPCISSVSLGSFLSRPGFLTGQGGMVLTTAKVPWSSASSEALVTLGTVLMEMKGQFLKWEARHKVSRSHVPWPRFQYVDGCYPG